MPPSPQKHSILLITLNVVLGVFLPGLSLLLAVRAKWAFAIPLLGLIWVCGICWSRSVVTPLGFQALLLGLAVIHIASYLIGITLQLRATSVKSPQKLFLSILGLIALNVSITIASHHYKAQAYGFDFYHVPSTSMQPTLEPGDILLADTWAYAHGNDVAIDDVVLFRLPETEKVMVKRVNKIKQKEESNNLYVLGDNSPFSHDSRQYGWVDSQELLGKAALIITSAKPTKEPRHLEIIK